MLLYCRLVGLLADCPYSDPSFVSLQALRGPWYVLPSLETAMRLSREIEIKADPETGLMSTGQT